MAGTQYALFKGLLLLHNGEYLMDFEPRGGYTLEFNRHAQEEGG